MECTAVGFIEWLDRSLQPPENPTPPEGEETKVHQKSNCQTDQIVQVRCGGGRECNYSAQAGRYEQNQSRPQARIIRTPSDKLADMHRRINQCDVRGGQSKPWTNKERGVKARL